MMSKINNKLLEYKKLESSIYFYKDNGSFGVVVYDDTNVLYKILELGVSENNYNPNIIERNNLVEIIMLNSIPECKNLLQSKSTFTFDNSLDKNSGKKIGLFQPIIYQKCPWVIKDSSILIFNRLKTYNDSLTYLINYKNPDYTRKNFLKIATQLLIGLNNLHSIGLLHGDIKSSNILYNNKSSDPEQFVLIDLGGVKLSNTKDYFKTCTLTYRCPEDLEYETNNVSVYNNSGYKSDIWSLGIVFAELLLGFNPVSIIYNDYKRQNMTIEQIEKNMSNDYKKKNIIDLKKLFDAKIEKENKKLSDEELVIFEKYIRITELMIKTNVEERVGDIYTIYKELTGEELNPKKQSYNYNYENLNNEEFLDFRMCFYDKVIQLYEKLTIDLIHGLPFLIDILDRFFSRYNELNSIDNFDGLEMELIGLSFVYLTTIWFESELCTFDFVKNRIKLLTNDMTMLKKYILQILVFMNYDIYRPFNVNLKSDDIKLKIYKILNNKIVGVSPSYY
jgi:serine/threonine protein kinase